MRELLMGLISAGLLTAAGLGHAADPATVRSLSFEGKNERGENVEKDAIRMPYVMHANQRAAARVNDRLFIDAFDNLAPRQPASRFGKADGIKPDGIAHHAFKVVRNDGRILSFNFEGEGCGAYCEGFSAYAGFDMRDGRMLRDTEIFTPGGIAALNKQVDAERLRQYRKQIGKIQAELIAARKDRSAKGKEIVGDLDDRLALNKDCERNLNEQIKAGYGERARIGAKVEYAPTQIALHAARCSNHASQALDDVGEVAIAMSYAKAAPHLTPYGKALLLGEGDAAAPATIDGQLMRGTIGGNMPITLLLEDAGSDGWNGKYFYDKYRKPIALSGKANGKEIVLAEQSEDPAADKATLRFTQVGAKASGQFIGKKSYPLELMP